MSFFHSDVFITLMVLAFVASALAAFIEGLRSAVKSANGKDATGGSFGMKAVFSGIILVITLAAIMTAPSIEPEKPKFEDHKQQAAWEKEQRRLKFQQANAAAKASGFKDEIAKLVPFCQWAVMQQSKYPSKASTGWHGYTVGHQQPDGKYMTVVNPQIESFNELKTRIAGTIDFMNGFGAYIPHKYQCDFKGDKIEAVRVVEGG